MRVLHLYSGNMFGGIETFLITLARFRDLCPEMEPHFGLCFPGRLWDELTLAGVIVHDLSPVRMSRPWTVLRARRLLKKVFSQHQFDAAVVHMSWPHAVFAPVIRKAGVRFAHVLHAPVDRRHWLNRWAARTHPDLLLANSQFIAKDSVDWLPGVPIENFFYPVAPADQVDRDAIRSQLRSELATSTEAVVILQASRLERWKGQMIHLESLSRLRELPNWVAWFAGGPQIAGETSFFEELKATAIRLGIADRVRFLGQRKDIGRLMMSADIFCQPNSGPEPFGIVFVEALLSGLPVVTSNFGGGAEIVNGTCGILTFPGDVSALTSALTALISNPEYRKRLGATGPMRANAICSPETQIRSLAKYLGMQ